MKKAAFWVVALVVAMGIIGCSMRKKTGIKTTHRSQWTTVNADVATTISAAEAVLNEMEFLKVKASNTSVDGVASANKADGTKIRVNLKKKGSGTQVSVSIGIAGEPKLGADILKRIKAKAEAK
jgi:hypothetical protein